MMSTFLICDNGNLNDSWRWSDWLMIWFPVVESSTSWKPYGGRSYRTRIFFKVIFEHFDCDVKHTEQIIWTIWKNWQERGRVPYQKLIWIHDKAEIFLYVNVGLWGLDRLVQGWAINLAQEPLLEGRFFAEGRLSNGNKSKSLTS